MRECVAVTPALTFGLQNSTHLLQWYMSGGAGAHASLHPPAGIDCESSVPIDVLNEQFI